MQFQFCIEYKSAVSVVLVLVRFALSSYCRGPHFLRSIGAAIATPSPFLVFFDNKPHIS